MSPDLRKNDWNLVVSMNPKGYVYVRCRDRETYGPVDHIDITANGNVRIWVKWSRSRSTDNTKSVWRSQGTQSCVITEFANNVVTFSVEETENDGKRLAFNQSNFLYIEERSLQINLEEAPLKPTG